MRTFRAVSLTILAVFVPVSALHAQPAAKPVTKAPPSAAPAPSPAPPAANDIVRLKSGSSFRGALVEHDPKGRTLLQTDQGTRDFDSNDVAYAGPAGGDTGSGGTATPPTAASSSSASVPPTSAPSSSSSAAAPPAAPGDAVKLEATSPGVQFHVLGGPASRGGGGARPLCVAPCNIQLPAGTYQMGLSRDNDEPRAVPGDVEVRVNGRLEGTYVSKKGARVGGVLLIIGGSIVSLAGLGALGGSSTDGKAIGSLGLLAGGGGIVGGILLVKKRDEASIRSAQSDWVAPRTGFASPPAPVAIGPRFGGQF